MPVSKMTRVSATALRSLIAGLVVFFPGVAQAAREPPVTEIWSGKALNALLRSINKSGRPLNTRPNIPLDEKMLKSINLAEPAFKGDAALLKKDGKLIWPNPLQDRRFGADRDRFSSKFKLAVGQLKGRAPVDAAVVRDLRSSWKALNESFASAADDFTPSQYIEGRKYLTRLDQAVKALADPKVANYFNGRWSARGRTVAELVQHIQKKGLQFAPAAPGEEEAYRVLYQALRAFEAAPPPKKK